jgi:hypothetical protein
MPIEKMTVQGIDVRYDRVNQNDYISLTDIAKFKTQEPAKVIENWMRSRVTIEYMGLWEKLNNPNFNLLEFEEVKKNAGLN